MAAKDFQETNMPPLYDFLVRYVTRSHTRSRSCKTIFNCSDPAGIAGRRRCVMRRLKPVITVAALLVAIFGERWLRSKMHQTVG